jgi:DNA-binding NtrC family response regulator
MQDDELVFLARIRVPVLITAESSAERERCARIIHSHGEDSRGPFVTFAANRTQDAGLIVLRFGQARGGSLFIDDIALLSPEAQVQLFRLLSVRPSRSVFDPGRSGPRLIAGAGRHLDAERLTGVFLEPLYYRLSVIHLDLTGPTVQKEPLDRF